MKKLLLSIAVFSTLLTSCKNSAAEAQERLNVKLDASNKLLKQQAVELAETSRVRKRDWDDAIALMENGLDSAAAFGIVFDKSRIDSAFNDVPEPPPLQYYNEFD